MMKIAKAVVDIGGVPLGRAPTYWGLSEKTIPNHAFIDLKRSKSGSRVIGSRISGDMKGKIIVLDRELESKERLRRLIGLLKDNEAEEIWFAVSHAIFSKRAMKEIDINKGITGVITTDTIGIPSS